MKIAIASGYFDPLHVGHIEYFTQARNLADKLIVIVNNDQQAHLKKEYNFMKDVDRKTIVETLRPVDEVFLSVDTGRSVVNSLQEVAQRIRTETPQAEILFVNGGDRFAEEIPENVVCTRHNIKLVDGLGEKIRSSSELVAQSKQ